MYIDGHPTTYIFKAEVSTVGLIGDLKNHLYLFSDRSVIFSQNEAQASHEADSAPEAHMPTGSETHQTGREVDQPPSPNPSIPLSLTQSIIRSIVAMNLPQTERHHACGAGSAGRSSCLTAAS